MTKKPTQKKNVQPLEDQIHDLFSEALYDDGSYEDLFAPAMYRAKLGSFSRAELEGVLKLAKGFMSLRRAQDRAEALRKAARAKVPPINLVERAAKIFKKFNSKVSTPELVEMICQDTGMSEQSARTYIFNLRKAFGLKDNGE